MDFVRQLKIFVAVAEAGSFARAAESLRMTRPGVTTAINELEMLVGARLLQRTTRRTTLTGEGELLLAKAYEVLPEVDATQNLFGGSSQAPRGRLRVDIPVALARPLVIPALPDFRSRYPGVDIVLGVSDQPVDLVADAVDCVLRIGSLPQTSMIGRTLATMTMVLCGSPKYLSETSHPKTFDELVDHRAVHYFSGRGSRPLSWSLPSNVHGGMMRLPGAILVNDAASLIGCAIADLGLIQVPGLLVAEHLERGELVQVLPDIVDVQWPVSVMYPNRQHLAPQVRAFIDWQAQLLASHKGRWLTPL